MIPNDSTKNHPRLSCLRLHLSLVGSTLELFDDVILCDLVEGAACVVPRLETHIDAFPTLTVDVLKDCKSLKKKQI